MSRVKLGQSLNMSESILPMDAPNRPKPKNGIDRTYLRALNFVTVHETDNTSVGADADAHRRYLHNGGDGKSWHFTVDQDEVVKHLRLNERGIHANSGNPVCAGIEMCVDTGSDLNKTRDRAARLVAVLLHDTGLGIDRVVQHNHWSGKNCPRRTRAGLLGVDWDRFIEMVSAYVDYSNRGAEGIPEELRVLEPDMRIDVPGEPEDNSLDAQDADETHPEMPIEFLSDYSPSV